MSQRRGIADYAGKFPNPFDDIASKYIPTNIKEVFDWCDYLFTSQPTLAAVSKRNVSYFLTDIILEGQSEKERTKYEEFLRDKLKLMQVLRDVGTNFSTYGNAFVTLYLPFDRYLKCGKCNTEYPDTSEAITFDYDPANVTYTGTCPKCRNHGGFSILDRRSTDSNRARLVLWNPKEIEIRSHPVSGETTYFWDMNAKFRDRILNKDMFFIRGTPLSMLRTAAMWAKRRTSGDGARLLYQFDEGAIKHIRESNLAGIDFEGWGVPPILPNFRLSYYIQLLRRYDEAIAQDYIIPFRVIFPQTGPTQGSDPLQTASLAKFTGAMKQMVENRRKDPTAIQVAPVPVGYQALGGEARNLAPKDNLAYSSDELLNNLNYPAELYKCNLSVQAAPVALRLYAKNNSNLVGGFNEIISWILPQLHTHFKWGEVTGKLNPITLADDLSRQSMLLNLQAGQKVSDTTALKTVNLSYEEEMQRMIQDQQMMQRIQNQAALDMQASQMQDSQGGGGGGDGGGGGGGGSPGDLMAQASDLAMQLLGMDDATRTSQLIDMKGSNPTLHGLVKQRLADLRSQAASQGQQQVIQQMTNPTG